MKRLSIAIVLSGLVMSAGALAEEPTAQAAVRSFQFNYGFTVKDVPAEAQSIKVWIPIPQSNAWQSIGDVTTESNVKPEEVVEDQYGNHFYLFDFSTVAPSADKTYSGTISIDVTRYGKRPIDPNSPTSPVTLSAQLSKLNSETLRPRWLQADTMVPLTGHEVDEAKSVAGTETEPLVIARKLYDHIVDTVKYDKSGPPGTWGRGDAEYACDVRAGNCTDFHSLFIGEARSLGIPARFTIGFNVPSDKPAGDIAGYHCWAEFWTSQYGWLPIDASEAAKNPARRDELFGGLDQNRVDFAWGRDIQLPEAADAPVNFIIYPYVEVDGKKYDSVDKKFSYQNK